MTTVVRFFGVVGAMLLLAAGSALAADNGTGAYIAGAVALPSNLISTTVGQTVTVQFVATLPRDATTTDFTKFPIDVVVTSIGTEGVQGNFSAKNGRYQVTAQTPGAVRIELTTADRKHVYASAIVNFGPTTNRPPADVVPLVPNIPLARTGDTISMTFTAPDDYAGNLRLLIQRSDWEISTFKEFPYGLKKGDRYQIPLGNIAAREPRGMRYCYVELLDEADNRIALGTGLLPIKQGVKTFEAKLDPATGELIVEYYGELKAGDASVVLLADAGFYLEFKESEGRLYRQISTTPAGELVIRLVVIKTPYSVVLPEGYYAVGVMVRTGETFPLQLAVPDALFLAREVDLSK